MCDLFQKQGLCLDIVSAGGTGTLLQSVNCDVLTETQAGGAVFGDPYYTSMPNSLPLEPALTVQTTVVSRPSFDRAVLDAGRKAITAENHRPLVKTWPDANVIMHNAEHIVLELGSESRELRIGDQVELIVGYSDFTTCLHDQFIVLREDHVEAVWPIAARGKMV
jgi:D-serine deaminase-like pyridoxal phosphate-dependent protein